MHGEARLFDPTRKVWREIHSKSNNNSKRLVKYFYGPTKANILRPIQNITKTISSNV
jgi:hypothetical protein